MDMIRSAERFIRAVVLVAVGAGSVVVAQEPPTIDQVIAGLERREELLLGADSMSMTYERINSTDMADAEHSGSFAPAEWTLSYKADKWRVGRRFTNPGVKEGVLVPDGQKIGVVRDGLILDWETSKKLADLGSFDQGGNVFAGLYFTRNCSIDAGRYIIEAAGAGDRIEEFRQRRPHSLGLPYLPEFLKKNRGRYRVLPKPREIDGRSLWVLEWPGMDTFCVDVKRGFAVPWRKFCWEPGKPFDAGFFLMKTY
jgi:hypothetical protein